MKGLSASLRKLNSARVALLLLLMLGWWVRVFGLSRQSLWHDEGVSFYLASQGLTKLLAETAVTDHPPLYFVLLHFWIRAAGRGEFSLRFLSALFGELSIPLIWGLGRRIYGSGAGFVAALLLTVSPFHVWYSQETRSYTLWLSLVIASFVLLGEAWERPRLRRWFGYALSIAAALYTHFYTILAVVAQSLYVILLLGMRREAGLRRLKERLLGFCLGLGAVALAFSPWIPSLAWQYRFNRTYWQGRLELARAAKDVIAAFAAGKLLGGFALNLASVLLVAAFAAGVVATVRERPLKREGFFTGVYALMGALMPIVLLFALTYTRPKFTPRYVLITLPFWLLVAARGVLPKPDKVSKPAFFWLAGMLLLQSLALGNYYHNPRYFRDDFRKVVRYINAHSQDGDAVVVVGGHAFPVVQYYLREDLALYPMPQVLLPEVGGNLSDAYVADVLNRIASRHSRVWLVLWQEKLVDPLRRVFNQLNAYATRLPVGIEANEPSLALFSLEHTSHFPKTPEIQHVVNAVFADNLELVGYALGKGQWLRGPAVYSPGETIYLTLFWRARGPVSRGYTAFTHLISPQGVVYGEMDIPLGGGFYPSSRWKAGEIVRQDYPLPVRPDTPPGLYSIEVGLYRRETMERLPVLDEDGRPYSHRVVIGPVEVRR